MPKEKKNPNYIHVLRVFIITEYNQINKRQKSLRIAYTVFEDVAFFVEPLLIDFLGVVEAAVVLARAEARVDRVEEEVSTWPVESSICFR